MTDRRTGGFSVRGARDERGIASAAIAAIVVVLVAGGAAAAYVATDAFGTGDGSTQAESTTSPAPTETELEPVPTSQAPGESAALPDGLPDDFPDIGIPFYSPSELVASPQAGGQMWVLEFVTSDDLYDVNVFIEQRLQREVNDWTVGTQTVEGQMTITHASTPGYELVIAVGPERAETGRTSLHYTLRSA